MKQIMIKDFLSGKIKYDKEGQYFWNVSGAKSNIDMVAELRGWGHIQNMFKDGSGKIRFEDAYAFQDEIGQFIADAINEKLERLKGGI
jgi:hypothetical protein